jgi:ribosomal protein S18 acetylase RimI-like enzyme
MSTLITRPMAPAFTLRWMLASDLAAVTPLADQCATLEWSGEDFRECFRSVDTIGKVVEADGRVLGFLIYKLDHDLREVFIKHIAVDPEWQRHGAGRMLLRSLDRKLHQAYDRITALVPESNFGALYLLRDAGYKAARVMRGWFGDEDAYVMQKTRNERS